MSEPTWPLTIRVPWDIGRTTSNALRRLKHWSDRAERNKAARDRAFYAWKDAGEPRYGGKVRVSLVVRRGGRRLDNASCIDGCKPVIDGALVGFERRPKQGTRMFLPSLLGDDGPDRVEYGRVEQETGKRYASAPEVLLVIEPAGEQS